MIRDRLNRRWFLGASTATIAAAAYAVPKRANHRGPVGGVATSPLGPISLSSTSFADTAANGSTLATAHGVFPGAVLTTADPRFSFSGTQLLRAGGAWSDGTATVAITQTYGGFTRTDVVTVTIYDPTQIPLLVPGSTAYRSWGGLPQTTIDALPKQGSASQFGYNTPPIVNWLTPVTTTVRQGGYIDIYLAAKKAPDLANVRAGKDVRGINYVDFYANNGAATRVFGTQRVFHPDSGEPCFRVRLREQDAPASGPIEIRAHVYPDVGSPFIAWGRKCAGPASATSLSQLTDTAAGPRGFSIDARAFYARDVSLGQNGQATSFWYGPKVAGTGIWNYAPSWSQDCWSLTVNVDKGDGVLPRLNVYIDGLNGSDASAGLTEAAPVKTMDRVKAIWDAHFPGGDYGGLTVIYCGTAGGHPLPSWSANDTTFYSCATQPVTFKLSQSFDNTSLWWIQPAGTYNATLFEKIELVGMHLVDTTLTIVNQAGGAWAGHADVVAYDCLHTVTRVVTSADANYATYGGTPYPTGFFGGGFTSATYSGHVQLVRTKLDGSAGWNLCNCATLVLACNFNKWCPQSDILDTVKGISGLSVTGTASQEGNGGAHMDLFQMWQIAMNMSVFGVYIGPDNFVQCMLGTSAFQGVAWDCCYFNDSFWAFSAGYTPMNISYFDCDMFTGQTIIAPGQNALYGDGKWHDSRMVVTTDSFSVPLPFLGASWTPSRAPGLQSFNGVATFETTPYPGKSTIYVASTLVDPADGAPAASTEWDYLSPYHVLDANLTQYMQVVTQGTASGGTPYWTANDPRYPWLGADAAQAVSPVFSPANTPRVYWYNDPIHVSSDLKNTWIMYDQYPNAGNFGDWDHNRPVFEADGLTPGNNTLGFNGDSSETTWPVQKATYFGGANANAAMQNAGEYEFWAAFQWRAQDTRNTGFARVIGAVGSGNTLKAVYSGGTWYLQASVSNSGGAFSLQDSPGFPLVIGKNYFVRLQVGANSAQITVYYDGAPTGHAFNSGVSTSYPSAGVKNYPTSGVPVGFGGLAFFSTRSPYSGISGYGHSAMGLNLGIYTPNLTGNQSVIDTTVAKLRARAGF